MQFWLRLGCVLTLAGVWFWLQSGGCGFCFGWATVLCFGRTAALDLVEDVVLASAGLWFWLRLGYGFGFASTVVLILVDWDAI